MVHALVIPALEQGSRSTEVKGLFQVLRLSSLQSRIRTQGKWLAEPPVSYLLPGPVFQGLPFAG